MIHIFLQGLFVAVGALTIGCVEIRDKDEASPPAQVQQATREWDLVIEDTVALKSQAEADQLSAIRRLYIGKNGILISNGYRLALQLQELMSDNGLIMTYPAGQTAAIGENGRHGGLIQIHADLAVGNLRAEMRGERGGRGKTYSPSHWEPQGPALGHPGLDGATGGDSGFLILKIHDYSQFQLLDLHAPGLGGEGGYPGPKIPNGHSNDYGHLKQGQPGRPGDPGNRGSTCFNQKGLRNCSVQ